jgi:hypothetical protein
MKKEVICKNCKKSITVRSWANDRVELAREKGEFFNLKCKSCGEVHEYNVNEVSANTSSLFNSLLFITVLVIMAILGYYLFNNFWGKPFYMIFALPIAIAIPGMIYFTYVKSQNGKVRDFNRFRK